MTSPDAKIRGPVRFLLWLTIRQKRRILTGSLLSSAWMVTMALPPYLLSRAVDAAYPPTTPGRWRAGRPRC
ncbi:hypothetical protein [Microtetraspora sp. AC03309]|uniref:hypothetical protein n=1 Tax=Microtetraspora sp. AC03309 TaxID=2779376 RepID=UPI001E4BB412|nr:hypothetical protein [Microtetraspora sp. AC03309]